MNKKKYIGHISISIILIIAFIAIIVLFSTLFKVTSENLRTQATVELGALEGTKTRTENVGSACTGSTVYCEGSNVNSEGVPSGYFCIEDWSSAVHQNYYSAIEFSQRFGPGVHSAVSMTVDPPVEVDETHRNEFVCWGPGTRHVTLSMYLDSLPGYQQGRKEDGWHVRSNTFWECTGDHRPLSPKMAYIVTDGNSSEVEKQWSVWRDPNENMGPLEPGTDPLTEASNNYADYDQKIKGRKYTKCN